MLTSLVTGIYTGFMGFMQYVENLFKPGHETSKFAGVKHDFLKLLILAGPCIVFQPECWFEKFQITNFNFSILYHYQIIHMIHKTFRFLIKFTYVNVPLSFLPLHHCSKNESFSYCRRNFTTRSKISNIWGNWHMKLNSPLLRPSCLMLNNG